ADISTDLHIPADLDKVQVELDADDGTPLFQRAFPLGDGAGQSELPMRVGFERQGSSMAPVRVKAVGFLGAKMVVARSATLEFLTGKVVVVSLPLLAACAGVVCAQAGQTCIGIAGCNPDTVDPTTLPIYKPVDGGAADGPRDTPAADGPGDLSGSDLPV